MMFVLGTMLKQTKNVTRSITGDGWSVLIALLWRRNNRDDKLLLDTATLEDDRDQTEKG